MICSKHIDVKRHSVCFPRIEKNICSIFFGFEFIRFSNRGVLSAATCTSTHITKTQYKQYNNTVNTSTHITKTPTLVAERSKCKLQLWITSIIIADPDIQKKGCFYIVAKSGRCFSSRPSVTSVSTY